MTTKTYESTGKNFFLELFEKTADSELYIKQHVTLTVLDFHEPVNNPQNINMGPHLGETENTNTVALKRPQKWFQNKTLMKSTKLSTTLY